MAINLGSALNTDAQNSMNSFQKKTANLCTHIQVQKQRQKRRNEINIHFRIIYCNFTLLSSAFLTIFDELH